MQSFTNSSARNTPRPPLQAVSGFPTPPIRPHNGDQLASSVTGRRRLRCRRPWLAPFSSTPHEPASNHPGSPISAPRSHLPPLRESGRGSIYYPPEKNRQAPPSLLFPLLLVPLTCPQVSALSSSFPFLGCHAQAPLEHVFLPPSPRTSGERQSPDAVGGSGRG